MLISFAVTAKLICVFVFAYAKSRFSYDEAHLIVTHFLCSNIGGVLNVFLIFQLVILVQLFNHEKCCKGASLFNSSVST